MSAEDIIQHRLKNQLLVGSKFIKAEDVVHWMGAMQAQEYAMAKWAIGLRMKGDTTEAIVEEAFQKGKIIRTHVMRPTWHFVSPENLRILLSLTAPRVHALNAYYYKQAELDSATLKKCNRIIEKFLRDGEHLTRDQLKEHLADADIKADGLRLAYIFMYAELEQLICSGPRHGKQFTYALIDEWVPAVPTQPRDEMLAWFTEKYFTTRGPAAANDFAYWSGLTVKEVKQGIDMLPKKFTVERFEDGKDYYFIPSRKSKTDSLQTFLMPDYDEYGMSYKERSLIYNVKNYKATGYEKWLVVDGTIQGAWSKEKKGESFTITPFSSVKKDQRGQIESARARYEKFHEQDVKPPLKSGTRRRG